MKRLIGIFFIGLIMLASCAKVMEPTPPGGDCYPEGTPVTMKIAFGTPDFLDVSIGTKAEASPADESRVRELYVLLFDEDGNKFYSRNFSYSQKISSLPKLINETDNDGWYVETDANGVTTRGVVKLSTVSKSNCTMVVITNVSNTISRIIDPSADGYERPIDYLARVSTLSDLKNSKVILAQDIVTRSDLFLMMGTMENVNTGSLIWGKLPGTYYSDDYTAVDPPSKPYQIELKTLDVKVQFRVKYDTANIDPNTSYSRDWKVYNVPTSCYLFDDKPHVSDDYFDTQEAFFDGTETDEKGTWEVFTFYMLENYQTENKKLSVGGNYYNREKQEKDNDPKHDGYKVNGDWIYAPDKGTYVWFDMVLGLKDAGVTGILASVDEGPQNPSQVAQAMTSKAAFTVHLGDFGNEGFDDYTVKRNYCYTYNITIENTTKIYVEVVKYTQEDEPGQEGSLLMVTEGIVNCDAHYEYHALKFEYDESYLKDGISWFIKTPFSTGGEGECKDYLWVKFAVNDLNDAGTDYLESRKPYPENDGSSGWVAYNPAWTPTSGNSRPPLMDVKQLIAYIIGETRKQTETGISDYKNGVIRITAYVDEYYYEFNPIDYQPTTVEELTTLLPPHNPGLWRQFVNKPPRELHILSNTRFSQDRQSDVILANNSIIQQSIQTFYNIYSPGLTSLWGTEHLDEMEYRTRSRKDGKQVEWPWWPMDSEGYFDRSISSVPEDEENGRINTAKIWGLYPDARLPWNQFLNYSVNNNTPELLDGGEPPHNDTNKDYKFLAYSCLTRNRDNNFNGVIDPEEVRWYTAAVNQLVGMWVGNESLTPSARLYQPMNAANKTDGTQWRAWVISSTGSDVKDPSIIRAEEGCTKSNYAFYDWAFPEGRHDLRNKVTSIRCVRNIGSYQEGGEIKDISYAPYAHMVDQYYEFPAGVDANGKVNANPDGTYTIRFSHLNPKSIREYTSDDLPYHDEYSIHNCVYQELVVQDPANYEYADGSLPATYPEESGSTLDELVLNNAITELGHNYYCPQGYRLPNMTELLLMESLLKSSYWKSYRYPCRTYYRFGKNGSKVDGEDMKIGWAKQSGRVNLIHENQKITGIRCVRDENRTGVIVGAVTVDDADRLRHDEDMTLHLNISSLGSAIKNLSISLAYIAPSGLEEEVPITPEGIKISGVSLHEDVVCHIPDYDDLPILGNITVRVRVSNHTVSTPTVLEAPITLLSPVFTSLRLLHVNYDEGLQNPPFPVLVTASAANPITTMRLKVVDPDGITSTVQLFNDPSSEENYLSQVYPYRYRIPGQEGESPVLQTGTYRFQLEVVSNGQMTRSEAATMEVLLVNEQFNTGTNYTSSDQITGLWEPSRVDNVDFFSGDFVEANMDIHTCTYKEYINDQGNRDNNKTVGRDNLISVGITDTDHGTGMTVPNVFHIYYPAHDGNEDSGQDWLRPNPSTSTGTSNGFNYKSFTFGDGTGFDPQVVKSITYAKPDLNAMQHFRFDKNGVYWNDQMMDLDLWSGEGDPDKANASFNAIRNSTTLHIGSTQGYHHSRAKYWFVRFVHNSATHNAIGGGGTGFDHDLNPGGDL